MAPIDKGHEVQGWHGRSRLLKARAMRLALINVAGFGKS